jgi:hypothetical protein
MHTCNVRRQVLTMSLGGAVGCRGVEHSSHQRLQLRHQSIATAPRHDVFRGKVAGHRHHVVVKIHFHDLQSERQRE